MKTTSRSDTANREIIDVAADQKSAATPTSSLVQNPPVYSFSKIKTFYTCKYQYYLNYVLPYNQRPPKHENAFSQYGSFIHEILEKFFAGELAEFELTDYYRENFDIAIREEFPPNAFVDLYESYYNDGYAFLESLEEFTGYRIIGTEKTFITNFDNPVRSFKFKGVIDLILEDKYDGSIIIQDWKSKSRFKNKEEQKEYARQLYLYAKHIKDVMGVWPSHLRFGMFRKGKTVEIPFRTTDYEEAVTWAAKGVEQIEACEQWTPTMDDWYCSHLCDFRDDCQFAPRCNEFGLENN